MMMKYVKGRTKFNLHFVFKMYDHILVVSTTHAVVRHLNFINCSLSFLGHVPTHSGVSERQQNTRRPRGDSAVP